MTFQELQVHQHQAHAIAREALKTIAQASNMSFQVVSKLFRQGDESATYCFWDYIEHYYPNQYNRVDFCETCKKFNLYWVKDDGPLSGSTFLH
jgi:hypothetical protein